MTNGARQRFSNSRLLKCFLFVASFGFALLAAEAALRCFWHNPYANESPDRVVRVRLLHANADHRLDRSGIDPQKPVVPFRMDDRSYILPSFQFENPDCTIAFLGGSTTECCAVDEPLRFPALVSTLLEQQGIRATTLNAGASGNTLHDSINNLLNHVEQDKPDIVVLMHACNDIGVLSKEEGYAARSGHFVSWKKDARSVALKFTRCSHLLGISRQIFNEHTHFAPATAAEQTARASAMEMEEATDIDGDFEKRLRVFIRMAQSLEIEPVIMTQPMSEHFTELTPHWLNVDVQARFNDIIRRVGKEENAQVIDLVEHLENNVPDWDRHMHVFYDGIHVTDAGSQIYGHCIADALKRRLCDLPTKNSQDLDEGPMARGSSTIR